MDKPRISSIKIGEKFIISSDKSLPINKDSRILINLNPGLGFGTISNY